MTQLDALMLARDVRERLTDFALGELFCRDAEVTRAARAVWSGNAEHGGLAADLWVEGAFGAKTSAATLASLAAEGVFSEGLADHLAARGVVPRARPLYAHQEASIRSARGAASAAPSERPGLVVTAGTGAGKTEAFLLPCSTSYGANQESAPRGCRPLVLYPMNALVNDQVSRLYRWLSGQSSLRLFHFTSETPEDPRDAANRGTPTWEACRVRTRREARESAPDIVITNYSMLEYMLCRPQDAAFFGRNLRVVVLDEAHLYAGTLATEIMMLMRRLLERCGRSPEEVMFIATSATLGGSADVTSELRTFGATLFGKRPQVVEVIQGESARRPLVEPARTRPRPRARPTPSSSSSSSCWRATGSRSTRCARAPTGARPWWKTSKPAPPFARSCRRS
jgi:DEAD/DEAH box helicase domain-containing protein